MREREGEAAQGPGPARACPVPGEPTTGGRHASGGEDTRAVCTVGTLLPAGRQAGKATRKPTTCLRGLRPGGGLVVALVARSSRRGRCRVGSRPAARDPRIDTRQPGRTLYRRGRARHVGAPWIPPYAAATTPTQADNPLQQALYPRHREAFSDQDKGSQRVTVTRWVP